VAVKCSKCGEELLGAVNRCWRCGQAFVASPEAPTAPSADIEAGVDAVDGDGTAPKAASSND